LNKPEFSGATILVAGVDFGTGSSREHAVWALQNYGFKVVLSSRFADIFRGNSQKAGLLTVVIDQSEIEAIWDAVESEPKTQITVDLQTKTVAYGSKSISFDIDDYTRWRLMEGLDDIGLTLKNIGSVSSFEESRPTFKPKTLPALS
jgi:3-isopropylmalate/(R)-2-methylmalate dehydratase small subunit